MKILLTGSTGFIGSHIARLLIKRHYRVVPFAGDITKLGDWEKNLKTFPDIIIQVAGIRTETPKDFEVNAESFEILDKALSKLAKKPSKIIYTSTQAVYFGLTPPFKETMRVNPENIYAKSKYLGEIKCHKLGKKLDVRVIILRLSAVIGKGVRKNGSMSFGPLVIWTKNALSGKDLDVFQDGQQTRDYVHVDDVANAVLLTIQNVKMEGIFNVGGRERIKLIDFAKWVKKAAKSKSKIVIKGGQASVSDYHDLYSNISKIKKFGWRPKKTAKAAIYESVDSYSGI